MDMIPWVNNGPCQGKKHHSNTLFSNSTISELGSVYKHVWDRNPQIGKAADPVYSTHICQENICSHKQLKVSLQQQLLSDLASKHPRKFTAQRNKWLREQLYVRKYPLYTLGHWSQSVYFLYKTLFSITAPNQPPLNTPMCCQVW